MSIYTKKGDQGQTNLGNNLRVKKDDKTIDLLGTIDELSSFIGLSKSHIKSKDIILELEYIQRTLITLMGQISGYKNLMHTIKDEDILFLEKAIDRYQSMTITPKEFILPGKTKTSAYTDVARTVARRAERLLVKLNDYEITIGKYLNRLSDYLYILGRYLDLEEFIREKVESMMFGDNSLSKKKKLNLEIAKSLIKYIEKEAARISLSAVIAIVNKEGNPIAVHVMDDAYIASYDIALNKGFTSVSLKMSTETLSQLSQPGQELYGVQFTNNGRIIIFGGGVPLKIDSHIVGGLGVSGGSAEQDTYLANFGEKIFKQLINEDESY